MNGQTTFTTAFSQRVHIDPVKLGPKGWVSLRVTDDGTLELGPGSVADSDLVLSVIDAHTLAIALYLATTALDLGAVPE